MSAADGRQLNNSPVPKAAGPLTTKFRHSGSANLSRRPLVSKRPLAIIHWQSDHSRMRCSFRFFMLLSMAILGSCGSPNLRLPSCWRSTDLRQGSFFKGAVILVGGYNTRPMMFPISCDGGVTADLPAGVLPPHSKEPFGEALFYQADVEGVVKGTAFGRPSVELHSVVHVQRARPTWLRVIGHQL